MLAMCCAHVVCLTVLAHGLRLKTVDEQRVGDRTGWWWSGNVASVTVYRLKDWDRERYWDWDRTRHIVCSFVFHFVA